MVRCDAVQDTKRIATMKTFHSREEGLWTGEDRRFESLPSTNSWALEHLHDLQEGDVVRADAQTAGRGRFGRAWFAVPGKCLTLSVVLKDPAWIPLGPNLGQIAALALLALARGLEITAQVKWPNDLMVNDHKTAGILVERHVSGAGFVVGIGLNVNVAMTDFDQAGLDRPATSLALAAGHPIDCDVVRTVLYRELARRLDEARNRGLSHVWDEWRRHDWLTGHSVRILGGDGEWTAGEYMGICPDGGLRLNIGDAGETIFLAGDVERLALSEAPQRACVSPSVLARSS